MAHQTAAAAAFKAKMSSRMTARTLVRTALKQAGKPLTLHQLYECVSSNASLIPSKTFFRNEVLSPLKAASQVRSAEVGSNLHVITVNSQVRSVTPSATGESEYRFRLANTSSVAEILSIDQLRWEAAGTSFSLSMKHLEASEATKQDAAEQVDR